jgi:D-3-phosphoglycerate dehydrogenase / 2-oxoglutarate reductase
MDTKPLVLLLDGRYSDYELERDAVTQNGGLFELSGSLPLTEEDVLAIESLGRATILLVELAPVTRAVLTAASSCRAVVRYGTGQDNIDAPAAEELGILVFTVPGYAAESVSEHAMALILASARRLFKQVQLVREGEWRSGDQEYRPVGLVDATIGIVGVGAIGRALATRARAFGMRVVGYDPYVSPDQLVEVVEPVSLDQLFEQSDYVSLHLPLTDSTREIIDAKAIARMKRGAVIVNTSRGGLINETDLLTALDDDRLSFACLDVTATEPLPVRHPLRTHSRVLVTPHVAFWSDRAERNLRTSVATIATQQFSYPQEHA